MTNDNDKEIAKIEEALPSAFDIKFLSLIHI